MTLTSKLLRSSFVSVIFLLVATQAFSQASDVDCSQCVDKGDIAPDAISSGKIQNGAVTTNKIADRAVRADQIKGGSITQGKIRDEAVTANKIRAGAVTADKLSTDVLNSLGGAPATCSELQYEGTIWGRNAIGLDLRDRTNSTLHFIGCMSGETCDDTEFVCTDDPELGTLEFGSSDPSGTVRALVDGDRSQRGFMTGGAYECSSDAAPNAISNAPDTAEDTAALCNALGYPYSLLRNTNSNGCPAANAGGGTGKDDWGFDQGNGGAGIDFLCSLNPIF